MTITKERLLALTDGLEADDLVDLSELLKEASEAENDRIEALEERQESSGFYAFQDAMWNMRNER